MTSPAWELAEADPVGAVVWWTSRHERLLTLLRARATGDGNVVGARNEPPYPRIRVIDSDGDLGTLNGRMVVALSLEVLGDPDGTPGKAALRKIAVALGEVLEEMCQQPEVQGCVFSALTVSAIAWSPLPPVGQPRYVLTARLVFHPAWPS